MTDQNPSGDSAAPGADHPAPAAPAETPFGTFASTRGSGLARGKRSTTPPANAEAAPSGEYKPTAVAMITPQREYRNPFASETPASQPAEQPVPVHVAAPIPAAETQATPASAAEAPIPEAPVERSELKILPAAEANRPAVSWETPSAPPIAESPAAGQRPRHEDRPIFRTEGRREGRPEGREPRGEPFRREGSRNEGSRHEGSRNEGFRRDGPQRDDSQRGGPRRQEPRADFVPRAVETPRSSGGFIGWLKGLFGAKKAPEETPRPAGAEFPREGEGHRHRRRRRGGRGHHQGGEHSGPRYQSPEGPGGDSQRSEHRPEGGHPGEHRRPRHRGGRGRNRGEHRTEGHQGGGAI